MTTPQDTAANIAELAKLYRQLLRLTKEARPQEGALDPALVEGLISRRALIFNKIEALQAALGPGWGAPRNMRQGPECQEVQGLLNALLEEDKALKISLEADLEARTASLAKLALGERALKNYGVYRKGIAYYVNHKKV